MIAAAAVHIENCEIERFRGAGIRARPFDDTDTELFVTDSVSRDNRWGIHVDGFGSRVKLTVENSRFENNRDNGMEMFGGQATITRTIASGNGGHGIVLSRGTANIAWTTAANNDGHGIVISRGTASIAWTTAAGNLKAGYLLVDDATDSQMTLESSLARGNAIGLFVSGPRTARISSSVFTNNDVGIENEGVALTRRNNIVSGNAKDLVGKELTPLEGI